jgi:hypothetical protein
MASGLGRESKAAKGQEGRGAGGGGIGGTAVADALSFVSSERTFGLAGISLQPLISRDRLTAVARAVSFRLATFIDRKFTPRAHRRQFRYLLFPPSPPPSSSLPSHHPHPARMKLYFGVPVFTMVARLQLRSLGRIDRIFWLSIDLEGFISALSHEEVYRIANLRRTIRGLVLIVHGRNIIGGLLPLVDANTLLR